MLHQEVSATYFLVAFLLCAVALFSCILVFVKICVRSTTRWHISPLATALTIFHLFGHVEFSTLAMIAKSNDIWTALLKSFCLANFGSFGYLTRLTQPQLPNSLQWHIHKGPAAYTLAVLAVWECVVFIFSPHYFSNHRPRGRSFGEWLLFLGLMWLAATSIDLAVHLPVIKRSGNSNTMIEIFESKETFVKATIALVALFLAPMVPFAFALDLALYDGSCLHFYISDPLLNLHFRLSFWVVQHRSGKRLYGEATTEVRDSSHYHPAGFLSYIQVQNLRAPVVTFGDGS